MVKVRLGASRCVQVRPCAVVCVRLFAVLVLALFFPIGFSGYAIQIQVSIASCFMHFALDAFFGAAAQQHGQYGND